MSAETLHVTYQASNITHQKPHNIHHNLNKCYKDFTSGAKIVIKGCFRGVAAGARGY